MKALVRIFVFLTVTLLVFTHGGEDSKEEKLSNQKDDGDVSFDNNEKNLLKMMDSKLYFLLFLIFLIFSKVSKMLWSSSN